MITTKNQRGFVHRRPLTKTQKNGLRQKQAEADWKDLLEMRSYAPIKDQRVRRNTAMLLENQWNHLTEAATNTSIFGPANGVTGGALSATDSYATGDNRLPRVLLPMVRRIYPALMSNETVGVQPMPGPVALAFAIRYRYLRGANAAGDSSVNHRHYETGLKNPHGIKGINTTVVVTVGTLAETPTVGDVIDGKILLVKDLHDSSGKEYPAEQPIKLKVVAAGGTDDAAQVVDLTFGYGVFTAGAVGALATGATFVKEHVVGSSDKYE